MKTSTIFIYSISLALGLSLSSLAQQGFAAKLNAKPLPHERDAKDFSDGQEFIISPTATSFSRRSDRERLKKEEAQAAAKKAEEAKQAAIAAQVAARKEQLQEAKKQVQEAVECNNNAVALGKQGRWPEAIDQHEKAVTLDPRNKQYLINLSAARTAYGQQLMAKGDYAAASGLFRKALAAAQDNGLAGKMLAQSMHKQGLDAGSAETRLKVGDQLSAMSDFQGASIEYAAALQLDPSNAKVYIKLGDMAYRYGNVAKAVELYRQAIVKDSDCGAAYRQIGFVEMARNDLTGAAASLRKAVILDAHDTAAGTALVEIWRKQVATNPLLAENHLGLAGALQLTQDYTGADTEYRRLEALDPKNPGLEPGRASLKRAIDHTQAERHQLAATTLFNQGLRREALAEINQAVMLEPKNGNYQFLLGECLESIGNYQGAHQAYLTCVLIDPENNREAAARMKAMQEHGAVSAPPAGQAPAQNQAYNRPIFPPQQQQPQQPQQFAGQGYAPRQVAAQPGMTPQFPQQMPQRLPQQMAAQPPQVPQPHVDQFPHKSMYEGGSGPANAPTQMNFRTHDESQAPVSEANQAPAAAQAPASAAPAAMASQQVAGAPGSPVTAAGTASGTAFSAPAAMPTNDAFAKVSAAEAQKDYNGAATILRQVVADNLQNPEIHHRLAVNLMASGEISEAISEFRIASALSPTKKEYSEDLARAMAIHKRSLMSDATGSANGGMGGVTK